MPRLGKYRLLHIVREALEVPFHACWRRIPGHPVHQVKAWVKIRLPLIVGLKALDHRLPVLMFCLREPQDELVLVGVGDHQALFADFEPEIRNGVVGLALHCLFGVGRKLRGAQRVLQCKHGLLRQMGEQQDIVRVSVVLAFWQTGNGAIDIVQIQVAQDRA